MLLPHVSLADVGAVPFLVGGTIPIAMWGRHKFGQPKTDDAIFISRTNHHRGAAIASQHWLVEVDLNSTAGSMGQPPALDWTLSFARC